MNPLEQLAVGWLATGRSVREWRTWAPWAPALAGALAHSALVLAIVFAAHPLLSWAMAPWLRAVSGDDALRYPELFRRLPGIVTRADRWWMPLYSPLLAGWATALFAVTFHGRERLPATSRRETLGRASTLVLASLPFHLLIAAIAVGESSMLAGRVSTVTRALAPQVAQLLATVVRAVLLLVAPVVVLERRGLRGTLIALPGAAQHAFLGALMIAVLASLLPMPFDAWAARSAALVASGLPEKVAVVVLLRGAAQAVSLVFAAGAAALLHRSVLHDRGDWGG